MSCSPANVANPSRRQLAVDLIVVSTLALFLEVLLIRWHATAFRACAYFKNVTLLAAFLGLGLGFGLTHRPRSYLPVVPLLLAGQIIGWGIVSLLDIDEYVRDPFGGQWLWGVQAEGSAFAHVSFFAFFGLLFVTTILAFIPIGQQTGRLMVQFSPIRAYTINILGSLAGVILFAGVSFLWLPPVVWFGLSAVLLLYLLREHRWALATGAPAVVAMLVVVGGDWQRDAKSIYSPYQQLELRQEFVGDDQTERLEIGTVVEANKSYHLRAVNLSDEFVAAHGRRFARLEKMAEAYDLPYTFCSHLKRVLVVGAGAGNDVAAALRNGAQSVDAVEIDPAIAWIGKHYHPEQPYADGRVRLVINDARAFMKRPPSRKIVTGDREHAEQKYDLIVFGLLDSHTLLSGFSSVRLDNFMYTAEAFAEARQLLTDEGVIALSFSSGPESFICRRIYHMLDELFGKPPRCFATGYDEGTLLVAGADVQGQTNRREVTERVAAASVFPPATSDDWPFLYMPDRRIPGGYVWLILLLGGISVLWIGVTTGRRARFDGHFFFLGAAFLLIETRGITELALVFGTTWVVSSVVIAAVLVVILLANLYVSRVREPRLTIHYTMLAASLLAGYLIPIHRLLAVSWHVAAIGATALLVLPLLFAGVIFATSLRRCRSVPSAFASNLLGAILGGLCEYASMAVGFRLLYVIGLALYAASYACLRPWRQWLPATGMQPA